MTTAGWLLPRVLIGAAVVLSVIQTVFTLRTWAPIPFDWAIFVEAAERFGDGGLYDNTRTYAYRYSPVLAPVLGVLGWIGPIGWRVLHVVAALALPSWPLRLLVLASWPFWFDVSTGNLMVFTVLAAAWALRGNAVGIGAVLAMSFLIPRPLMFPLAAWLLWQRPEWRVPFVAVLVGHASAVLATGWGDEWIARLLASTSEFENSINIAPSRLIGLWWLAVALPAAAWLTWRGRLGWASLLAAPYWLPYYLLMPMLEIDRRAWRVRPRQTLSDSVASARDGATAADRRASESERTPSTGRRSASSNAAS